MSEDSDEPTPVSRTDPTAGAPRAEVPRHGLGVPGPLIFGVVAGTIEFAVVLWLLYC
jgi:hypothetical protein